MPRKWQSYALFVVRYRSACHDGHHWTIFMDVFEGEFARYVPSVIPCVGCALNGDYPQIIMCGILTLFVKGRPYEVAIGLWFFLFPLVCAPANGSILKNPPLIHKVGSGQWWKDSRILFTAVSTIRSISFSNLEVGS